MIRKDKKRDVKNAVKCQRDPWHKQVDGSPCYMLPDDLKSMQ